MAAKRDYSRNSIYALILVSGVILLIYNNYTNLWAPLVLYLLFITVAALENLLLVPQKAFAIYLILFLKIILAASCSLLGSGYGPLFLFYFLVIEFSRKKTPLQSGIISVFLLIIVTARELAFRTLPFKMPGTIIFHLLIFSSIYLLLHAGENEADLRREKEVIISQLSTSKKKLQDSNTLIRKYSNQVKEMTRLQERNRMSKGIHDTLGHTFTAILVQLNAALELLAENPEETFIKITNARDQAKEGLNSVRETIQMLNKSEMSLSDELMQIIKYAETNMQISVLAHIEDVGELGTQKRNLLCLCLKEGFTKELEKAGFTQQEIRIASLMTKGFTNSQIAEALYLSQGTTRNYVSSIYQKLNVEDRTNAVLCLKEYLS